MYNPLYYTEEKIEENSIELLGDDIKKYDVTTFGINYDGDIYTYGKYKLLDEGYNLINEMVSTVSDDILSIKDNVDTYYSLYKNGIASEGIFYVYSHFIDKAIYRYINTWNNLLIIFHKGYLDRFIGKKKLLITSIGCNYGTELITLRDFIKKKNNDSIINLMSIDKNGEFERITKKYEKLYFKNINLDNTLDKNIIEADILLINSDLFEIIIAMENNFVKSFTSKGKLIIIVNNKSRYKDGPVDTKYKVINKNKMNEKRDVSDMNLFLK